MINKLVHDPDNIMSLSVKEEFYIARFIVALRFRTPSFQDWNDEMVTSMLKQIKGMIRKQVYHQHSKKDAEAIWDEMKKKPDH